MGGGGLCSTNDKGHELIIKDNEDSLSEEHQENAVNVKQTIYNKEYYSQYINLNFDIGLNNVLKSYKILNSNDYWNLIYNN